MSGEKGAKLSVIAAGGVEGALYLNLGDIANSITSTVDAAAVSFSQNVIEPAIDAMTPEPSEGYFW